MVINLVLFSLAWFVLRCNNSFSYLIPLTIPLSLLNFFLSFWLISFSSFSGQGKTTYYGALVGPTKFFTSIFSSVTKFIQGFSCSYFEAVGMKVLVSSEKDMTLRVSSKQVIKWLTFFSFSIDEPKSSSEASWVCITSFLCLFWNYFLFVQNLEPQFYLSSS